MLRRITIIILTALLLACASATARAPTTACPDKRIVLAEAHDRGERLLWQGVSPGGSGTVLIGRPDGTAWRVYEFRPNGRACLLIEGRGHTGWQRTIRVPERLA